MHNDPSVPQKETSAHSQWMQLSFVASTAAILSDFVGLLAAQRNAAKAVMGTVLANIAAWGTAIYAQYRAHNVSMEEKDKDRQELLQAARSEAKTAVKEEIGDGKWQQSVNNGATPGKNSISRS
ncbi:MAG TPA: hypothetical protein VFT64_11805 [Rickettsiales bacterium]|nr:hypothetical protein [Rickettsiales bacterium]